MANTKGKKERDADGNVLNNDGSKRKRKNAKGAGRPRVQYKDQLSQAQFVAVEYYIQGMTKRASLLKAGYSESYSEDHCGRFFATERISKAVEERRWVMRSRDNKIVDRIKDELAKIAFFNIGHIVSITEEGDIIFDYSEATMDQFAAMGEITVETYTEGRGADAETVKRVKCKPYDKKAALDSLARINGMFNDKIEVNDAGSLEARLQRGRLRMNKQINAPDVIDSDFEEVE